MSRWMLIRWTTGLKNNIHTSGFAMQSSSALESTVKMYIGEGHTQPPFIFSFDYKGVIAQTEVLNFPDCDTSLMDEWFMPNEPKPCTALHQWWKMLKAQAKCVYFFEDPIPGKAKEQPAWLGGWPRQRSRNSHCIKSLVTTCKAENVIWKRGGTCRRKENFWRFGSISIG